MLKKPIKASRIANLTDARYFAAWDVQWLGFCLDNSADYFLRPQEVMAIREWITGPQIVGEFGWQSPEEILEIARLLNLEAVQVGPLMTPEQLAPLHELTLFQELVLEPATTATQIRQQLEKANSVVDTFLLNFSQNGLQWSDLQQSSSFKAEQVIELCRDFPILLDLNWPMDQFDELLEKINPLGLSVQGGAEEKIGFKSFDEIDEWFEALEILE